MDRLQFFRVAFTLRLRGLAKIKPLHWPTIHALIRSAYGTALNLHEHIIPDGLLLDAPDRARIFLHPGEPYCFGFTLLNFDPRQATRITCDLLAGLVRIGRTKPPRPVALGGNFVVVETRDRVADQPLHADAELLPVPEDKLTRETHVAQSHKVLTLRFDSPYRAPRPKIARTPSHDFIDAGFFDAPLFIERIQRRLDALGLLEVPVAHPAAKVRTLDNRLHWLDLPYGPDERAKTIGGAVGRVAIECHDLHAARQLVLGQYVRVGSNTSFGLGAYRIEELGPDPSACRRSVGLLSLATDGRGPNRRSNEDLPSGELAVALRRLAHDEYEPTQPIRIQIPKSDGGVRTLSIPGPRDRALQRVVLDVVAPVLDQLFNESSFAYRKNLGRHSAARRIQRAINEGWTFALRADFGQFFDSVDHGLLSDRLDATLADPALVKLLMRWVQSASPTPGRGLPTGAPISPMLANLFLDEFDDNIARSGGLLVRYADDFLILYRDRDSACHALIEAEQAARALALTLNDHKTRFIDLREPFDFLGFRFQHDGTWSPRPNATLRSVAELGWEMLDTAPGAADNPALLHGETRSRNDISSSWVVFGPGARHVRLDNGRLICVYDGDVLSPQVPIRQVRELIILGQANIQPSALRALLDQDTRILLADDSARRVATLSVDDNLPDPALVARQLACHGDPDWRLPIARRLVAAKVWNHSCLAESFVHNHDHSVADGLRQLAERCEHASDIESLLGFEGAAAARWYSLFGQLLPPWFNFRRRVAPDADDPGNILLNLAQTALHRQMDLAIRGAGLLGSIGVLHVPRPGHAALASDLQELFRHLMDRAVLQVAPKLKPTDFHADPTGPFPTSIAPGALRKAIEAIHLVFIRACATPTQPAARSYLGWFHFTARSLRAHLLDRSKPIEIFRHVPAPATLPEVHA